MDRRLTRRPWPTSKRPPELAEALAPGVENLSRQAEALNRLADLTLDQVGVSQAKKLAQKALDLARQADDPGLEADSLESLAETLISEGASAEAGELSRRAVALYRKTGDQAGEAVMLLWLAASDKQRSSSQANIDQAQQALSLAHQAGDRRVESWALMILGILEQDLAKKWTYFRRALNTAQAIGNREMQGYITSNLAAYCAQLGLYRRGLTYANLFIRHYPDNPRHKSSYYDIFGLNALGLGLLDEAEAAWQEGLKASRELKFKSDEVYNYVGLGLVALARGQAAEARQIFVDQILYIRQSESAILSQALGWLAAAHLALDDIDAAKTASAESVELFETGVFSTEYSRSEIWWHRYRVLAAAGEDAASWEALDRARAEMLKTVADLSDEGLRRNYFDKVAVNRQIIQTWLQIAAERGFPLDPLTDGLTGTSDLQEQFRRLTEIGVRLNTRQEERDLPAFILDEFIELTGAEEAAVILGDEVESGPGRRGRYGRRPGGKADR